MIKSMDRGLLLGRFWYIRGVDLRTALQTGLTRDGIWYIENGKIQYPVKNFRFNQSLMQLLAPGNVDMIGKPERVGSSEGQGGNAVTAAGVEGQRVSLFVTVRSSLIPYSKGNLMPIQVMLSQQGPLPITVNFKALSDAPVTLEVNGSVWTQTANN